MNQLVGQTLAHMESTLHELAARLPQPQEVPFHGSFVYRYVEKNVHQALIQKLARVVSGLRAAYILNRHGLLQEQAALQRMLDEFHEDIFFLCYAAIDDTEAPLHREYLDAFYEEEFDDPDPVKSTQRRPMPPRQKIRAFLARREEAALDPSTGNELSRTINKTYSGFVHGASPHIMDSYGGTPPRFFVAGMLDTPRFREYREDLWNYFYRGICSFAVTAKAFGDEQLFASIRKYLQAFEATQPPSDDPPPS
jgi:hypothetical protein